MDVYIILNMALGFLLYKVFYLAFGTLILKFFAKFLPDQMEKVIKKVDKQI